MINFLAGKERQNTENWWEKQAFFECPVSVKVYPERRIDNVVQSTKYEKVTKEYVWKKAIFFGKNITKYFNLIWEGNLTIWFNPIGEGTRQFGTLWERRNQKI